MKKRWITQYADNGVLKQERFSDFRSLLMREEELKRDGFNPERRYEATKTELERTKRTITNL